jgi:hypothetical protein
MKWDYRMAHCYFSKRVSNIKITIGHLISMIISIMEPRKA